MRVHPPARVRKPSMHAVKPGPNAWPIRALQIDLARTIETVDAVRRYADLAAEHGFNTLVLYLEGRVRTASFPFRPAEQSYTLEDMAKVVAHANAAGLDVVPVVSTLGHCEQFVRCPELAHLAEVRDGRARSGRPNASVICPSLNEPRRFFETYFAELAQVFTGPHFHAGLDEDWDFGFCNLCRDRWAKEGIAAVFTKHVRWTDQLLRKLGKRMWMWDDMYEFFPGELDRTPRDIVMCHWCYDDSIEPEGAQAHFSNRWRQDWLALYEQMGIDALVCPAIGAPRNIETITRYARRHDVWGGLLTQWGGSPSAHAGNSTIVAFTGRLWARQSADIGQTWTDAIQAVVPGASPALREAVEVLVKTEGYGPQGAFQSYLAGPLYPEEITRRDSLRLAATLLQRECETNPPKGGMDVLDRMGQAADREFLHWDLRELMPRLFDPRRPADDDAFLKRRVRALRKELADGFPKVDQALAPAWKRLGSRPSAADWWLVLRLFLQDAHGAPRLKVALTFGDHVMELADRLFKPPYTIEATGRHYTVQIPFTSRRAPDGVRVEGSGYGGQGVAFVEAQNPRLTLFPAALRAVSGPVSRPEAVLRDDSAWAYLGCPDIDAAFHSPALAEQRGVLDIALARR